MAIVKLMDGQVEDDVWKFPRDDPDHNKLRDPNDPLDIDPVIALIDMDCFYVQVELRLQPQYRGRPAGVTQYLTRYKGGGLIAVNYEARAFGVKRGCRAAEAKEKCSDFKAFVVPELNGKADLTRYREAGSEVIKVMQQCFTTVERASIDEAYVDLTSEIKALLPAYLSGESSLSVEELGATCPAEWSSLETWLDYIALHREEAIPGPGNNMYRNYLALGIGAKLINELRERILSETQFHCSAGISYSKTLAKLCCGLNKPKKQTVLPRDRVFKLFEKTEIQDVRLLGGKLGEQVVHYLRIKYMSELCRTPRGVLFRFFPYKTTNWLCDVASGWDNEPVQARDLPKSIGCSKNFLGRAALKTRDEIREWMGHFCEELATRLKKDQDENDRTATLLTAHMTFMEKDDRKSLSRCCPLTSYKAADLAKDGFATVDKCMSSLGFFRGQYTHPLVSMGLVASKMKDGKDSANPRIDSFFSEVKKNEDGLVEDRNSYLESTPPMFDKEAKSETENLDTGVSTAETDNPAMDEHQIDSSSDDEILPVSSNQNAFPASAHGSGDQLEDDELEVICEPGTSDGRSRNRNRKASSPVSAPDNNVDTEPWRYRSFNCEKCDMFIWCPRMARDHSDYHMALELSQEINKKDPNAPKRKLTLEDIPVKKKTLSKKPALTLDSFFKKEQ